MNEKSKAIQPYLLVFIFVLIIPHIFFGVSTYHLSGRYYEQAEKSRDLCIKHAKEDYLLETTCMQISSEAREAYSSATKVYNPTIIMLLGILFSLSLGMIALKKQIDELKEKLNV